MVQLIIFIIAQSWEKMNGLKEKIQGKNMQHGYFQVSIHKALCLLLKKKTLKTEQYLKLHIEKTHHIPENINPE